MAEKNGNKLIFRRNYGTMRGMTKNNLPAVEKTQGYLDIDFTPIKEEVEQLGNYVLLRQEIEDTVSKEKEPEKVKEYQDLTGKYSGHHTTWYYGFTRINPRYLRDTNRLS